MNSHQSLAEALEMCKYTENFTSRGGKGAADMETLPDPARQRPKTLSPRTVASLDTPSLSHPRPELKNTTPQHQKSHTCTAVCTSSLPPLRQRNTKPRRSTRPQERFQAEAVLCSRWRETKKTSARFTHKQQIYTPYNL